MAQDNYPAGLMANNPSRMTGQQDHRAAQNGERNPDAISSRIDQANSNLGSIEARLRDMLVHVRGSIPAKDDSGVNQKSNNMQLETSELLNSIERVSEMVNELRSLL